MVAFDQTPPLKSFISYNKIYRAPWRGGPNRLEDYTKGRETLIKSSKKKRRAETREGAQLPIGLILIASNHRFNPELWLPTETVCHYIRVQIYGTPKKKLRTAIVLLRGYSLTPGYRPRFKGHNNSAE